MPALFHSLYARIVAVYLVLLVLLCSICIWLIVVNGNRFVAEMEQRFNLMLASDIASQLAEPLASDVNGSAMRRAVARIVSLNRTLRLFVLSESGTVLSAFACPQAQGRVLPMQPLQIFLNASATLPVRGEDPCSPDAPKVFSVSPVALGERGKGYLYVILDGPLGASEASRVRGSYILRTLSMIVAVALAVTGVLGLILFAWLTRRFRKLTDTVERFEAGNYTTIAQDQSRDEIGDLSRAFNAMAATIKHQVGALEKTDAARRDLVANISHDFRTPLTALRGYNERLLANQTLSRDQQREYLQSMLESIDQLTRLADTLSALSQLDAHETAIRMEPFSLAELVQDLLVKFTPEAESRQLSLKAGQPLREAGLPPLVADIALVERALSNLVDNALRNTGKGGEVCIWLTVESNNAVISVVDTGFGIAENELALVTQRFYQTRESRGRGRSGSGLGLAIALEVAELHGGELSLNSQLGQGSEVSLRLPLVSKTH